MAKKRKAGGRLVAKEGESVNPDDSKLKIDTFEDVADSEDEFHINRDKILLEEGPAQKRQRRIQEEEEFFEPSDEEVLAESEDFSQSDDGDGDGDEDEDVDDVELAHLQTSKPSKSVKFGAKRQDSDSEVSAAPEDDEDQAGWGTSRKDYYNADAIETEADALEEEAEARRLQQKQLQGMTEEDFGFDEVDWLEANKNEEDDASRQGSVIREILPRLEITDTMSPEERTNILRVRYPEFELLAREFLDLQEIHSASQTLAATALAVQSIRKMQMADEGESSMPIAAIQHSALSAYLGALGMYFALFTSGTKGSDGKMTAMSPEELKDHTVMETLVQCRDFWERVRDIEVPESSLIAPQEDSVLVDRIQNVDGLPGPSNGLESHSRKRKVRKNKTQRAAEAAQAEADARRAERIRQTEQDLASLSTLPALNKSLALSKSSKKAAQQNNDSDSDFGDQTSLTVHEAAEKAKRKKSLRFYTSQIAQKSNKRDAAGRDAGGDADIPYRERLRDRQDRLNAEAEKRGRLPKASTKGEPLGDSSDDDDRATAQAMRKAEVHGSEEDYYDLVSSRTAAKKAAKTAEADAKREERLVRFADDEAAGPVDGKRAITYAIEKNKGLAPKRKKEVRNPRVKKRMKYEEKKKKLGSVRAVWKGGEGRGGYGGELTGIKKGLVRSVKL